MKKKNLKTLGLNKESISTLQLTTQIVGGGTQTCRTCATRYKCPQVPQKPPKTNPVCNAGTTFCSDIVC